MRKFLLDRQYLIFGLKRSGLHALVAWLYPHFQRKEVVYQNNTCLSMWDKGRANKHAVPFSERYDENKKIYINVTENYNPDHLIFSIGQFRFLNERYTANYLGAQNFVEKTYIILVLRNPINNYASLIKSPSLGWQYKNTFLNDWMAYSGFYNNSLFIPFIFDLWFQSKDYREYLAMMFEVPFTDKGLNSITSIGSSFDGKEFQGKAQEMDVLNRWQEFAHDEKLNIIHTRTIDKWNTIMRWEADKYEH